MCSIEHVANLSKIKDTFYPPPLIKVNRLLKKTKWHILSSYSKAFHGINVVVHFKFGTEFDGFGTELAEFGTEFDAEA